MTGKIKNTNRRFAPDILRTIAMLGVIVHHVCNMKNFHFVALISPWHVITFFFLSGYFYNKEKTFFTELKSRLKTVVVPWISWATVLTVPICIIKKINFNDSIFALKQFFFAKCIDESPLGKYIIVSSALYFCSVFVCATLLFKLLERYIPLALTFVIITVFAVIATLRIVADPSVVYGWGYGRLILVLPACFIIMCGYLYKKIEHLFVNIKKKSLYFLFTIFLTSLILIFFNHFINANNYFNFASGQIHNFLFLIVICIFIALLLQILEFIENRINNKSILYFFSELAQLLMGVYLVHWFIMYTLRKYFSISWTLTIVLVVIFSYLLSFALSNSSILSRLFLGRVFQKKGYFLKNLCFSLSIGIFVSFLSITFLSQPISDDLVFFARNKHLGVFGTIKDHLLNENSRYSQELIVIPFYSLTHNPQLSCALGNFFIILFLFLSIFYFLKKVFLLRGIELFGISSFVSLFFIFSATSIFDDFFWFTAASVYIPGIACFIFAITIIIQEKRALENITYKIKKRKILLISLFLFLSCGFCEIVPVFVFLLFVCFIFLKLFKKVKRLAVYSMISIVLSWVVIFLICSGTLKRLKSVGHEQDSLKDLTIYNFKALLFSFPKISLILSVFIIFLLYKHLLKFQKYFNFMFCFSVFFFFLVNGIFIAVFTTRSYRVFIFSNIFINIAVISLVLIIITKFKKTNIRSTFVKRKHFRFLLSGTSLLLTVFMGIMILRALPLYFAVNKRYKMVNERQNYIEKQVAENKKIIKIIPAPVLYYPTNALDFSYKIPQPMPWYTNGYSQHYFGTVADENNMPVKKGVKFVIKKQTKKYCSNNRLNFYDWTINGAKNCKDL